MLVQIWNTFMCIIVLICVHECKRIWYESARGCACVRVCGSSSGLLKACWEACHCKSGKRKSPKCTEDPPSPTFSVSLPFSITPSLSCFLSHTHLWNPTSAVVLIVLWKLLKQYFLNVCFLLVITTLCPSSTTKKEINQLDMNLSAQCIAGAIILLK